MTTNYTKVPKATGTAYHALSGGKTNFDDVDTAFDSSAMPFDGLDLTYTKVTKASGTSYTKIPKGV